MDQGKTLTVLSALVGVLAAIIILLLKNPVISLYSVTDVTRSYASQILYAMSVIIIFQTVGGLLSKGVLRGGGDTRFLIAADAGFLWLLSIPLGSLAGLVWGLPIWLVYVFLRIDEVVKAVLLTFRLLSGRWIRDLTV